MPASKVVELDRSVRILGPDGAIRRSRCSQNDALWLYRKGLCLAAWNLRRTRITVIQLLPAEGIASRPARWLKTGVRFSYKTRVCEQSMWQHKPLPYGYAKAKLEYIGTPEEVTAEVRRIFMSVLSSIIVDKPVQTHQKAQVISIEAGRRKPAATKPQVAAIVEMPKAA